MKSKHSIMTTDPMIILGALISTGSKYWCHGPFKGMCELHTTHQLMQDETVQDMFSDIDNEAGIPVPEPDGIGSIVGVSIYSNKMSNANCDVYVCDSLPHLVKATWENGEEKVNALPYYKFTLTPGQPSTYCWADNAKFLSWILPRWAQDKLERIN
jgi:hypothetical protein